MKKVKAIYYSLTLGAGLVLMVHVSVYLHHVSAEEDRLAAVRVHGPKERTQILHVEAIRLARLHLFVLHKIWNVRRATPFLVGHLLQQQN